MGPLPPTLHRLRHMLAKIDPNTGPNPISCLADRERSTGLGEPIDAALGGGLDRGALDGKSTRLNSSH